MLNSIQNLLDALRERRDRAYYARMRRQLKVKIQRVNLTRGPQTIKAFQYEGKVCQEKAGYVTLRSDGPNLIIDAQCQKDYRGPRLEDDVFINGKRLPSFGYGKSARISVPRDADIVYCSGELVSHGMSSQWVPSLVRIVPFATAA